jgi:hypothetical protein
MKKGICIAALMFSAAAIFSASVSGQEPTDKDVINVRNFGAKGDGITDDTSALQNAIDEALKLTGGLKPDVRHERTKYPGYPPIVVYIPRGTYLVKKTVKVPFGTYSWNRALRITGESAKIKAGSEMETVLHVNTASHITIQGLTMDAAGLAQNGLTAFKISGRNGLIERVNVTGALSHGIVLDKCQGSVFRGCSSSNNGGDGWHIKNCNAAIFEGCAGNNNKGNGFTVTAPDFSGGCIISGLWSEGNKGHGIEIMENVSSQVVLRDGWLEANGKDGVRVAGVSAYLTGLNIAGNFRDDSREGTPRQPSENASIRLTRTAVGCYVSGNQIRGGGLRGGQIRVEGNPELHYVTGNFRIYASRTVVPVGIYTVKDQI